MTVEDQWQLKTNDSWKPKTVEDQEPRTKNQKAVESHNDKTLKYTYWEQARHKLLLLLAQSHQAELFDAH